ncbi:MAG: hypothetical protein ACR2QH_14650 [Geminicoccaceae bacterium]
MAGMSMMGQPARLFKALTTPGMRAQIKHLTKSASNLQRPTNGDNVFLFSTPRSGSTWLMELILSQPGFRACDQPMDIRNPYVQRHLGISGWTELYQKDAEERLKPYLQDICDGRLRGLTTLWNHHRFLSKRLVFKIQNGWQERVGWMRDALGGRVVLLLRHPIAVTVSRKQLPRLETFVESDYALRFDNDIKKLAAKIIDTGSFFEKGILHWCFENAVPLQSIESDWTVLTYEQIVVDPETALGVLSSRLKLPDPAAMMKQIALPSRTTGKSNVETQSLVASSDRERLISKWRKQVSSDQERIAFEITDAFGIDIYKAGRDMPVDDILFRPDHALPAPKFAEH